MDADSQGNQLSEGQKAYFADSKVRDAQGKLIPVYHGTGALFNEFSFDFINTHGSSEGRGFYFTDSRSMAEGYSKDSGRVMAGCLDIKKPLSNYERTISRQEVTRLIKAIDPTGDDLLANYDPTGGMGYGPTFGMRATGTMLPPPPRKAISTLCGSSRTSLAHGKSAR